MKHIDIANALQTLCPNAEWNLRGDTVEGIEWLDKVQTQPSEAAIVAAIASYVPPPTLQDKLNLLQTQVNTLLAAQGK